MSDAQIPLVYETAAGDVYDLSLGRLWRAPHLVTVDLEVGLDAESRYLRLTPDEARALAAELVRWAGHAEREERR